MDTNKEKLDMPVYLPEDRELMLSLLKEYSERLMAACQSIDSKATINVLFIFNFPRLIRLKEMRLLALGLIISLNGLIFSPLLFLLLYSYTDDNPFYLPVIHYLSQIISPLLLLLIFIFSLVFFVYIYCLFYIQLSQQKQEFLKHSSRTIAIKLERIIRVASQIDEHIETSLAKRIEWDLRLTDAESALEYYELVTGVSRKKNL